MSDQEKSPFTVEDNRSTASDIPSDTGDNPITSAEENTTNLTESSPPDSSPDNANSTETENSERAFPDPSVLLSMAAMHLNTEDLMTTLIPIFDNQAWRGMGLIANHLNGEIEMDLPSAQLAIDCIQFLFSKVESRLPATDRRDLQRRMTDLRMNYVAKHQESLLVQAI